jgi:hypothetical protein
MVPRLSVRFLALMFDRYTITQKKGSLKLNKEEIHDFSFNSVPAGLCLLALDCD